MEAIRTFKQNGYVLETFYDDLPFNPRNETEGTKFILFHKRYNIGDSHGYNQLDYNSWTELQKDIVAREKPGFILPVYMYEHSGIALSISSFNDRWDSGQVGFAVISWKEYEQYHNERTAKDLIERELKYYSAYLNGECYGYRISEEQVCNLGCAHLIELDSAYGYYCEDDCFEDGVVNMNSYIDAKQPVWRRYILS